MITAASAAQIDRLRQRARLEKRARKMGIRRAPLVDPRWLRNDCCGVSKGEKCNAREEKEVARFLEGMRLCGLERFPPGMMAGDEDGLRHLR